jgi:hypothetical protein
MKRMTSTPKITPLNYTYKKPDTDVWVLNDQDIPLSRELIKNRQTVHLSPQSVEWANGKVENVEEVKLI